MGKVSRTTKIGELAMSHPAAVAVLMEHGFHCIGCGLADYETVEEGAMAHGFDDAEVDVLVKKMNAAIESSSRTTARPLLRQEAIEEAEGMKKEDAGKAEKGSESATPSMKKPADRLFQQRNHGNSTTGTNGFPCGAPPNDGTWNALRKAAEAKGKKADVPIIKPEWKAVGMAKPPESAVAEAEAEVEREGKKGKKRKSESR
jgi:hybrid cluster-associated redox disulfide protein